VKARAVHNAVGAISRGKVSMSPTLHVSDPGEYGLPTSALIEAIWSALGRPGPAPAAPLAAAVAVSGEYSPV
jgi:hypothetical protein